jgi:DNA replicative helicase MCM subunit Mcm2 (Cdc46/Mcm family)
MGDAVTGVVKIMFYCEECRKKKEWPESCMKSYGPCEMCKETRECYDVPSKYLPMPKVSKEEYDEVNEVLIRHGIDPKKVWD